MSCSKKHICEGDDICHGWDFFNGMEIARLDGCGTFPNDAAARLHIAGCGECQRKLGKHLVELLIDYKCFGVWPVFGDVHELPPLPYNPDSPGQTPDWWEGQSDA